MTETSFETDALVESVEQVLRDLLDTRGKQRVADGSKELGQQVWDAAGALGWLSVGVSDGNGGLGLGMAGVVALQRALGAATAPGAFLPTLAAAQWLDEAGADGAIVSALAAGEVSAAVLADFSLASRLACDDGRVSGTTELVLLGAPDAAHYLIPARDGRVLLCPGDPAVTRPVATWDRSQGLFAVDAASLSPQVIGEGGASRLESLLCLLLAADSQGGAEAILAETIGYLKVREQFGQPIGAFQALKHRVANHSADVLVSARIVRQAVAQAPGAAADMWARLAKAAMTETYARVAADAIQLHGGIGFTWEHPCHLYLKRARLNEALGRSNHALRDAASDALVALMAEASDPMEIAA